MHRDEIARIEIDALGRLLVFPAVAEFPLIYREAMEVGWDPALRCLFSPKPREWTYANWFGQLISATAQQGWQLAVTPSTAWVNVEPQHAAAIRTLAGTAR